MVTGTISKQNFATWFWILALSAIITTTVGVNAHAAQTKTQVGGLESIGVILMAVTLAFVVIFYNKIDSCTCSHTSSDVTTSPSTSVNSPVTGTTPLPPSVSVFQQSSGTRSSYLVTSGTM